MSPFSILDRGQRAKWHVPIGKYFRYLQRAYIYDWNNIAAGWQDAGAIHELRKSLDCTKVTVNNGEVVVVGSGWLWPDLVPATDIYIIATGQW